MSTTRGPRSGIFKLVLFSKNRTDNPKRTINGQGKYLFFEKNLYLSEKESSNPPLPPKIKTFFLIKFTTTNLLTSCM